MSGDGKLVLLVEDNEKNMKLARDILRFKGYRVTEATTGEDAVASAATEPPDLVLMDIQLPGIDGIEAFRRIRSDPKTATIPVVALTASVMAGDRERFDKAGFDGFIAKPIDVKQFPDQVASYLAKGRA
ncbi:MAG: response regulator [Chloroflexi bacterium]|nr:MAG: response regulator [Chloroflexota bacterium]